MSNEIKVGDKVRVREDAPRVYTRGLWEVFEKRDSNVDSVEDDTALISTGPHIIAIPLKYLVKVEEEKKEAKFKVGDKVIFIPTGKVKVVSRINANSLYTVTVTEPNGQSPLCVRETELAPYTEPTEQTEAEKNDADNLKKVAEEWANTVSNAIKEYGDAACKIIIDAHTEAYWDAYTADLAKEVVLKVANKFNSPYEAAEYAVKVAKAVAEGLKRK